MAEFHAICVGITHYEGLAPVPRAEIQAAELHRRLTARGVSSVLLLGDGATRDAFRGAVNEFVGKSQPGSLLLIYFNGHGRQDLKAPLEADGTPPEAIAFVDKDLYDSELATAIAALDKRKVLLILDACNSAGMVETPPVAVTALAFPRLDALAARATAPVAVADIAGWVQVIAAADVGQFAMANTTTGSPLTNAFVAALDRTTAPATYGDLFDLVRKGMPPGATHPVARSWPESSLQERFILGSEPELISDAAIQAHVLLGFPGHDQARLVFFQIDDVARFKARLRDGTIRPTSAADYPGAVAQSAPAQALSLTYRGLERLGAADLAQLGADARSTPQNPWATTPAGTAGVPLDNASVSYYAHPMAGKPAFQAGMRYATTTALGDPWQGRGRYDTWTVKGTAVRPIHGLLVLADNDEARLDATLAKFGKGNGKAEAEVDLGITVLATEAAWRSADRKEHFGFRDGISTPGIRGRLVSSSGSDRRYVPEGATTIFPPEALLVRDGAAPGWARDGSFLVYRRLNQDVAGFNAAVKDVAARTGRTADDVAADLMGRHKDGAPLGAKRANPAATYGGDLDAYDYQGAAAACPPYAHARKSNPRLTTDPAPPLFRRGLLLGGRAGSSGGSEVGLHFLCYQASIERQFESVSRWMNNPLPSGVDALVGRDGSQTQPGALRAFPGFGLPDFIYPSGGEYLFAPSLAGLASLAVG